MSKFSKINEKHPHIKRPGVSLTIQEELRDLGICWESQVIRYTTGKRKFDSPEKMRSMIDAYFNSRDERKPPTMVGIALFLGFATREAFLDYEKKHGTDFTLVVGYARSRIEEVLSENLTMRDTRNARGPEFLLRAQHGYFDGRGAFHQGGGVDASFARAKLMAGLPARGDAGSADGLPASGVAGEEHPAPQTGVEG